MQPTIQINIAAGGDLRELLIAQLSEAGFDGFEEEENNLIACCSEELFNEIVLKEILDGHNLTYEKTVIPPQNWNEVWESNFQPVVVDDFVAVRASFHAPVTGVEHEIIITPKMSFGTGHHATTYMMMQQMRGLEFNSMDVFDFGTGTGILAILAKQLGARNVTAIDIDEWSINNAKENFDNNGITGISLMQAETPAIINGQFDIILANINKNVLLEYIPVLSTQLKKGGFLLLSGLLAADEPEILLTASQNSLFHNTTIARDKWICILIHA
ncbi:MAG TPA: 50S ribosomal protein L11 methyltransferase [Chitinophagaceae bacterium]|nr:50S ribosomal protein L11 methyltransferase [Chitinophagaceae bacterium]